MRKRNHGLTFTARLKTVADIFVDDCSASKNSVGRNCVGYAVTTADTVIETRPLTSSNSAQSAELTAVVRACLLHRGQSINIHTDSQYVFAAVHHLHHSAKIWQNRGMLSKQFYAQNFENSAN